MDAALHLIADRIAAMPPPALPEEDDRVYEVGYREGHEDAIKRVGRLLRWIADGEAEDLHTWVWVRNLHITDKARKDFKVVHELALAQGRTLEYWVLPKIHPGGSSSLYVPMPKYLARQWGFPFVASRPDDAVDSPLTRTTEKEEH